MKDGMITRMRPIIFDDKVDAPSWVIEARGEKFTPPRKTTLQTYEVPERQRVYENRIHYPLQEEALRPQRREASGAARQRRVCSHFLGRSPGHRRRRNHPDQEGPTARRPSPP